MSVQMPSGAHEQSATRGSRKRPIDDEIGEWCEGMWMPAALPCCEIGQQLDGNQRDPKFLRTTLLFAQLEVSPLLQGCGAHSICACHM